MNRSVFVLLILLAALVGTVAAAEEDAAQITVTAVRIDPEVMIRGDTATITVEIINNGDENVPISRATLRDKELIVVDENTYASVGTIGAGNQLEFTFTVRADAPDGIYYPKFTLDFPFAPSLRYYIPFKIESTDLQVSIIEQPDSYAAGKKEALSVTVGNPRENGVNGVSISVEGEGIEVTQSGYFIGSLAPDESSDVTFEITPRQASDLTVNVQYRNGINLHSTQLTIPVVLSDGKKRAEPILNNIELSAEGGYYRVTGDVTNAGLDVAKSVVITTGAPGEPVDPFRIYVVGALDPDDFSSFEVTFRTDNRDPVPLIIQYKDEDGNLFERVEEVEITTGSGEQKEEGLSPVIIGLVVVLAIAIVAAIAYTWKKK